MFMRKVVTTVAVAAGLLVLPALPGSAAPSGGCPYPPHRPVLNLGASPHVLTAGSATTFYGTFLQNSCGIKNATIELQRRLLINGQPSGSWHTYTTRTTNTNGVFDQAAAPKLSRQERAVFLSAGGFPTTVSNIVNVWVRIRVTEHLRGVSGCRIHLSGGTLPKQPNRNVFIQNRGPRGHFDGWTTIAKVRTQGDGTFVAYLPVKCGTIVNLSTFEYGTSMNLANRSGTIFWIRSHR